MVAVMVERTERGWTPTGDGHELLSVWALWSRGDKPGGASNGAGWSERLDSAREETPPESVVVVDRILANIGVKYPDHRRAVKAYYLDNRAAWEIAAHMMLTHGYVRLMIQGTCDWVCRQYEALTAAAESPK